MRGPRTLAAAPRKPRLTREAAARKRAAADRAHDKYVQKTYGLAPGQYAEMLAAQGGRCAICRRVPRKRKLAVDHDHRTGRVRALLCYLCNKYLGQWEFSQETAANAARYLDAIAASYDPGI